MMTRRTLLFFAFVCLLFVSQQSSASVPIRACDFVTTQTASLVFRGPVKAGREEGLDMGAQRCVFDPIDPASSGRITFTISDASTMATALHGNRADLIRFLKRSEAVVSEPIPSLGEWNSCMCSGTTENTLAVIYQGKVLFLVSSGSKNPHPKAALVQAMRRTMQKL
jgi:hypothetical protein